MDRHGPFSQIRSVDSSSLTVPGTLRLEDAFNHGQIKLHPVPTRDPNDPLNWSAWRKTVNFALACLYVLLTFVQVDIGFTSWQQQQAELGFSVDFLNTGAASNYAGLGVGCILFVPLVYRYGRRPCYLLSTLLQLVSCVWLALTRTRADYIGSNILSGLSGAISEVIVQVTIADLFFVHHHAAMNAWYLLATFAGSYIGPAVSGVIVERQGWRWMWWHCVIFFGANLVLNVFLFEESKFVNNDVAGAGAGAADEGSGGSSSKHSHQQEQQQHVCSSSHAESRHHRRHGSFVRLEEAADSFPPKPKTYRQRMALVTTTRTDVVRDLCEPLVLLVSFPAITFTALTFGSLMAWFAVLTSIQATYMFDPPYNFSAVGVGLMNLAAFIGCLPGIWFGGYLNDQSILWLSRRNNGVYEPEMRLWLALPMAIITPAGSLLCGLGLAYKLSWPVVALGWGIFGFGFVVASNIALAYSMDCYHDIIGNALVGVIFTRNAASVIVLFILTPWINQMGLRNQEILVGVLCFVFLLLPAPFIVWGKMFRAATAKSYLAYARRQPTCRQTREASVI